MGQNSAVCIVKKWEKWDKKLPAKVNIPRKINLGQVLEIIDIHVFGDRCKFAGNMCRSICRNTTGTT